MIRFTIPGRPVTKKNHMRIAVRPDGGPGTASWPVWMPPM